MPPLGLITVAAMFPPHFRLRLVDMNVRELTDEDLEWADLVLTSTMVVQQRSLQEVIARANRHGRPVAVGGPHPTSFADEIHGASHFLLDEVEETLPRFLADWEAGGAARLYRPDAKPPVTSTPVPRFDLLELERYSSMALQFSRGCPFDCEFCDITKLFGRVPRTKTNEQMLRELGRLDELGWRGPVFLVDDNFIGNKKEALRLLPAVAAWQEERGYPFDLFTEASVNLAQSEPLMDAMVAAGFSMVFLGIESPNPEALKLTKKTQNTDRSDRDHLLHAVHAIQRKGLEVSGGFILGLDGDGPEVFDAQVEFVQRAGIPMAMVGLLSALRGTDLYARMEREGRLLEESSGNNVEIALNFRPQLDRDLLVQGYRRVLATLYDPSLRNYFARCATLLGNLGPTARHQRRKIGRPELLAFARSVRRLMSSRQAAPYLRFVTRTLLTRPRLFPEAVRLGIMGLHFQRFTRQTLAAHDFREAARAGYERVETAALAAATGESRPDSRRRQADEALRRLQRLHRRLRPEFRRNLLPDWAAVEKAVQSCVREAPALQYLQQCGPRLRQWFAEPGWAAALQAQGYALVERWRAANQTPTVAVAPILEQGKLRRSLELYLSELGVKVMTSAEQMTTLGQAGIARLLSGGDAMDRLLAYLRALGQRIDGLIVPLGDEGKAPGGELPADRIQVLASEPQSSAVSRLPHLVCLHCKDGWTENRRRLRTQLVELGVTLAGDPTRAETAFERAFALS